ncbi:MAG: ABC transporter permease [bacterium]|nr:ABC transporter permease [bacterium]
MRILVLVRKDLLRAWRDRRAFVVNLLLPLLLTFIMGLSFGGGIFGKSGISVIPLVAVGEDVPSALRDRLAEQLAETDFFALEWADSTEARRRVTRGEAAAAVVLPPGAVGDYFRGEELRIDVWKDPGRPLKAGIVEQVLQRALRQVQAGEAGYRALWPDDEESMPPGAEEDTWSDLFAGDMNTVWKRWRRVGGEGGFTEVGEWFLARMDHQVALSDAMAESRLDLAVTDAAATPDVAESREINLFSYFLPGFSVFFLMFGVAASARDLHRERAAGTLQRQLLAPLGTNHIMTAKWLSSVVQGAAQMLVLLVAGAVLFRVDLGPDSWSLLTLVVLTATAAASFFMMLAVVTPNEKVMDNVSTTVVLVAAMVGGNFVPVDAMPAWITYVGRWVFNYWSNSGFSLVMVRGESLAHDLQPAVVLAAMTVGYGLLALAFTAWQRRRGGLL